MRAARAVAGAAVLLVAGLGTVGSALGAVLEANGFGADRDAGPDPLIVGGYVLAAVVCCVVGIVLWQRLVPHASHVGLLLYAASVGASVLFLGIFR